jgi:hypothetical protein
MQTDYQYSEQSRRPITIVAFLVAAIMIATGVAYKAPWYFMAPMLFAGAMLAFMIAVNRKSGMELKDTTLRVYSGKWEENVSVSEIVTMKITRWMEGAPTIVLVLSNNKVLDIPGYCCGFAKDLSEAVASRGILIEWK